MASDLYHNFLMPEDVDANGSVTPIDALIAIDRINRSVTGQSSGLGSQIETMMVDVNADESISPLDALAVIDILNSRSENGQSGALASRVQPETRMQRIQRAVDANALPPGWTIDQAQAILETLREGGRPELGVDINTIMPQPQADTVPVESEDPAVAQILVTGPILESIVARLQYAGAASEIIDTIRKESSDAIEEGSPLGLEQVQARLGQLGFSWDTFNAVAPEVFPVPEQKPSQEPLDDRSERDEPPIVAAVMVTQPVADSLMPRLAEAGVSEEILAILSKEIYDAIAIDRPLSMLQVRLRLVGLGG